MNLGPFRLSLSDSPLFDVGPEEVKNDEVLLVPVDLDVVVERQLGQRPHLLQNHFEHVMLK